MLTNYEIADRIKANNNKIRESMNPSTFVLSDTVRALVEENKLLQRQCTHDFNENNVCVYCNLTKEEII